MLLSTGRRVIRNLNPFAVWHILTPKLRVVIKFSGVDNNEKKTIYFSSFYHFINDIPSLSKPKRYDFLICQNFLHQDFLDCAKPKVFFSREPMTHLTQETRENLKKSALKDFLYRYDDPNIKRRMFYVSLPENRKWVTRRLQRSLSRRRPKLCCIINRYAEDHTLNLLEQRIHFVKAFGANIDIYGRPPWQGVDRWPDFSNYLGHTANKHQTLSQYTFTLVFENSDSNGYITEKILHALVSGTIPLYWGGGSYLVETIPAACFLNCRNRVPEEVRDQIKSMPQDEIEAFRHAGIEFLGSDMADRFTRRHWADNITARLKLQSREAH